MDVVLTTRCMHLQGRGIVTATDIPLASVAAEITFGAGRKLAELLRLSALILAKDSLCQRRPSNQLLAASCNRRRFMWSHHHSRV